MFYRCGGNKKDLPHDPFKACVVPRPIGWVSTIDSTGAANLAPFSFFNAVNEHPPMVMYCANGPHISGGEKDSVRNARDTGEFVINLATWELRHAINISSACVDRSVNEFELAGVTPVSSTLVRPQRVLESPINLECVLTEIHHLPCDASDGIARMVIGRVLGIHIADHALVDGRVSTALLRPISRLGYRDYALIGDAFEMVPPGLGVADSLA
jgi:flavin reductase (DIM6/NTAB) family NADH-FMN oxidoreductase RutF